MTNGNGSQAVAPEVYMVEYFNDHWYKINLEPVEYFPSTTTKLGIVDKPGLARWRGDVGNREADFKLKEGQEKGSSIHNAWFVMCQSGAVVYQSKRKPQFTQIELDRIYADHCGNVAFVEDQDEQVDVWKLQKWDEILQPEYLHHELILYSLTHKEAGTCDKIIRIAKEGSYLINGSKPITLVPGIYVVDLKTGSFLGDEAFMQIADYREMAIEMGLFGREEFVGGIILHTGSKVRTGIRGLSTLVRTTQELDQDYIDFRHASELWLRKHKNDKPEIFEFPSVITLTRPTEQPNKE